MTETVTGSCLCGGVRYRVSGVPKRFFLCHCTYCQKSTGSAHVSNLFMADGELVWEEGEDLVKQFDLPDTRYARRFCSVCGGPVPRRSNNWPMVIVPAGTLDSETATRAQAHIFIKSRAAWDDGFDAVPVYEEFPPK